jgi:hypothetical protein
MEPSCLGFLEDTRDKLVNLGVCSCRPRQSQPRNLLPRAGNAESDERDRGALMRSKG